MINIRIHRARAPLASTRSNHHHIFITLLASSSLPRTPPITRRTPLSRQRYRARSGNNRSRAVPSVSRAPSSHIDRTVVRTRRRAKAGKSVVDDALGELFTTNGFDDDGVRQVSFCFLGFFVAVDSDDERRARGGTRREKWRRTSTVVPRRGARDGRDARAWYAGEV